MMRKLPVLIEPFTGETVSSVYRRLTTRNAVPAGELWTTLRHARPRLPLRTTPELVPRLVEDLADLPPGFFDGRRTDRLFVRCIHADWRHNNCPTCAPLPSAVTKCRRCTGGEPVEVRTRIGAVSRAHRRWHYAGADRDLAHSACSWAGSAAAFRTVGHYDREWVRVLNGGGARMCQVLGDLSLIHI